MVADESTPTCWSSGGAAERQLLAELSSGERLRTPVNFIVHSQAEVDDALTRGRYFFMDIMADGVELLSAPDAPAFVEPQPLAPDVALAETQAHYEDWIPSAAKALRGARFYIAEGDFNDAAFLLHQAAERLYNGVLLVTTLYTPKSHNLIRLRNLAEQIDPTLIDVWPTETKAERRGFELLKQAYVKARYSRRYKVTAEELAWMIERIELLQARVIALCEARLAAL